MPGAVVLVVRKGKIVKHEAYGFAAREWDDQGNRMDEPVPMKKDTLLDLASISKIFTSVAVMKLYEEGKFRLDDPVAKYIPEFAQKGKAKVTIRQLMTHTSGFEAEIPLHELKGSRKDRIQAVFAHSLIHEPGEAYLYSDLNAITLGALVERLSGQRQDVFVAKIYHRSPGNEGDDVQSAVLFEIPNCRYRIPTEDWAGAGLGKCP